MFYMVCIFYDKLVGWLCFTSHRQQGHLETAPPFTVPCEGREAHRVGLAQSVACPPLAR